MTTPIRRLIERRDINFDSVKMTPHVESLPELRSINPEAFTTAMYYEGTRAIVFGYSTSGDAEGITSNFGGVWVAKNLSGYTFNYDSSTRILRITPDVTEADIPASIHQENIFVQQTENTIAQLNTAIEVLRNEVAALGPAGDPNTPTQPVDLTGLTDRVSALETTVAGKADQSEVNSLTADINTRASQSDVNNLNSQLAGKANQADVDSALDGKADQTAVDAVDTRLDRISDEDEVAGTENIGRANVDGQSLRNALAQRSTSGGTQPLPDVVTDFFEDATEVHSAGQFTESTGWSRVSLGLADTDGSNLVVRGDPLLTSTYDDSRLSVHLTGLGGNYNIIVAMDIRDGADGVDFGFFARDAADFNTHTALPILRTTNGGVYQVATGVNDSFEHVYQNVQDQFGNVSRENGDKLIIGYRAYGANPNNVQILPTIKRADGSVIECNQNTMNITFTSVLNSVFWRPLYISAFGVANHGSISLTHNDLGALIAGDTGTATSDSIVYGLGTFGSGSDRVVIAQDVEFSGEVTGAGGTSLVGAQGPQGPSRVYLFAAVAHDATAPATPSATYDGSDLQWHNSY